MATRIKASAVRRRVKRRSERASHKKNTNATLRSRKQRARKTAKVARKVMRGGGAVTLIYKNTNGEPDEKVGGPWTFFKLEFDKNKFSNCYTLKLTFDLNNMNLNVIKYITNRDRVTGKESTRSPTITRFSIPSIIDSIFYSIFDYDYNVTTNFNAITIATNPDSKWFDYGKDDDENYIRNKLFNLATNAINGHWENVKSEKKFGQIMEDGRFKNNCVVELEFCPSDSNTTVQLKKYTDIKKGWRGYWEWETITPKEKFITVKQKLDVQRIEELKKSTEFYLFLPSMHWDDNQFIKQFYWFDEKKLDKHIQVIIDTSERQYEEKKRQEEKEKAEEKAAAEAKASAEKERRDKMTPEEREAEDKGKAEAKAKAAAEAHERWKSTPGPGDYLD